MFRDSGYMKRRIAKRLGQVELQSDARLCCDAILRRAVLAGAGQEFREYCKLANKLQLSGLEAWLEPMAKQAVSERVRFGKVCEGQWQDPEEKKNVNARRMLCAIRGKKVTWSDDIN